MSNLIQMSGDILRNEIISIARTSRGDPELTRQLIAIVDSSDDPVVRSLAACAMSRTAAGRPEVIAEVGWLLYRNHQIPLGRRIAHALTRLGTEARWAIPGLLAGSIYQNRLVAVPVKKLLKDLASEFKSRGHRNEADDLILLLYKCRGSRGIPQLVRRIGEMPQSRRFSPLALSWIARIREKLACEVNQ